MGNTATVPMFSPDGKLGDIPADQMHAALQAGFKPGVTMKSPDGKLGVIPADRMPDAAKSGMQIVPLSDQETQHAGFWHTLYSDLGGMAKGLPSMVENAIPGVAMARATLNAPVAAQHQQEQKQAGYNLPYRVLTPAAEGLGVNVRGMEQSAQQGDVAGVAGHAAAVPVVMAATEGLAKAAPVISDVARAGADRAAQAAEKAKTALSNATPKQVAQGVGGATGAVAGHGPLSIPGAYYGGKTFGHVAEIVLGKDRANSPIFKNADLPLDSIADSLAQTIADDRARFTEQQGAALGRLPQTGAVPAAKSGEALATTPKSVDLTEQAKTAKSAPRFNAQDRAAAVSLLQDALKQHTGDIVDAAIPPTNRPANLMAKAQINAALKRGDVPAAEKALDSMAQRTNPSWQPPERQIVQSTRDIRANLKAQSAKADALDTHALQQEMAYDLMRHGWSAEQEARREFIARNSNDYVKTQPREFGGPSLLSDQLPGESTPGKGRRGVVKPSASDDLTDILQKSLDEARKQREGK